MKEQVKVLDEIKDYLILLTAKNPKHVVFDNSQLAEFLNVSTRTLLNWRNEGLITFHKVGSSIFYTLADVLEFLDLHKIEATQISKSNLKHHSDSFNNFKKSA